VVAGQVSYYRKAKNELAHAAFNSHSTISDRLNYIEDKLNSGPKETPKWIYTYLQSINVQVIVPYGSGSGVIVARNIAGTVTYFVWTAGHVAECLLKEDGSHELATIQSEVRINGKYVTCSNVKAKVIAYSDSEKYDLALLEIVESCPNFQSAMFASISIPEVGTKVIHCGSPFGLEDSVSFGIISQTDRNILDTGGMFDQTSTMGYPGSSGGGVFTTDGKCIGLLVRSAGAGMNFIVPIRRMHEWALKVGVLWALDPSIPVPTVRAPTSLEKSS
jgi:hypothetical protein